VDGLILGKEKKKARLFYLPKGREKLPDGKRAWLLRKEGLKKEKPFLGEKKKHPRERDG